MFEICHLFYLLPQILHYKAQVTVSYMYKTDALKPNPRSIVIDDATIIVESGSHPHHFTSKNSSVQNSSAKVQSRLQDE